MITKRQFRVNYNTNQNLALAQYEKISIKNDSHDHGGISESECSDSIGMFLKDKYICINIGIPKK